MAFLWFSVSAVFRAHLHLQDAGQVQHSAPGGGGENWVAQKWALQVQPEPGGRRSSEGHPWAAVGARLGLVLSMKSGFRSLLHLSGDLN